MPKVVDLDVSRLEVGQIAFSGTSTPTFGTLVCDGSPVSRVLYSKLFEKIGVTFGSGDGVSTFNLPDLRSRSPVGSGTGPGLSNRPLGASFGAESHTLTEAEMPQHAHPGSAASGGAHTHTYTGASADNRYRNEPYGVTFRTLGTTLSGAGGSHFHAVDITDAGGTQAHTNMAPCLVGLFVIAFK